MTTTTHKTDVTHPVLRVVMPDGTVFLRDTEGYVAPTASDLVYEIRDLTCGIIRLGYGPSDLLGAEWDCVPVALVPPR